MKAIGITCGIGSMLVGARKAGFDILSNIEWRKYYHHRDEYDRNTFEENFPEAILVKTKEDLSEDQLQKFSGADLAMGHPECGNYSTMSATAQKSRSLSEMNQDPGDIPIFANAVKTLKPRFFVQDNLPKSLLGFTIQDWAHYLPEYDLYPEWVSNWGYGNIQKYRKRFFMIGSLKEEKYVFTPREYDHAKTYWDIHCMVRPGMHNHEDHTLVGNTSKGKGIYSDSPMNWEEYKKFMLSNDDGVTIPYISQDGSRKKHIGWRKAFKNGYVPVITGGCPIANPVTGLPFSIRERCFIQGLPEDFLIYGTKLEDDGTWNHSRNSAIIKQTGKCMPVQFCEFVSQQIADHISGSHIHEPSSAKRILSPNLYITEAKQWYCKNVGYSDPVKTCQACWMKGRCEVKQQSLI